MREVEAFETRAKRALANLLEEADEYFMESGPLAKTLHTLARDLEDASIPYALLGALAPARHGFVRLTLDIALPMTPAGLDAFNQRYVGRSCVPAFPGTGNRIEVVTSGEFPGDGRPKPISFPDPVDVSVVVDGIRVVRLERLIELKLASGLTAPHRRCDLTDVQDLVCALKLPEPLAGQLDSSVREKFIGSSGNRLRRGMQFRKNEPLEQRLQPKLNHPRPGKFSRHGPERGAGGRNIRSRELRMVHGIDRLGAEL